MTRGFPVLATHVAVAALLLLALPVRAVPETEAARTNPLVVRAWHEPDPVVAGEQWHAYLQLKPGHGVARVGFQVCNAGDGVCFAPRHDAVPLGNDTFRLDTADYLASDARPVDWQAGWLVGIRWFLADESGNGTWVPRDPPTPTEDVAIPDLYLTFQIPGGETQGAPLPGLAPLTAALLLSALLRRRA